ncbi:MAG: galactosyltransferase-related protein [Acidimicrobiales bacterium]
MVAARCDHCVFAAKPGAFNKSWAVNVGVVQSPGEPELVCVLDADVLPDRDFPGRNVGRFLAPGVGAVSPYRDMACLDPASTALAIDQRLVRQRPAPDPATLRMFLVRRPPGLCLWVRHDAFRRVAGMDERFEGWGGEDNDFFFRVDRETPLDRYDDPILHLHHPASSALVDGQVENWSLAPGSWPPDSDIGRLDRFTGALTPVGDSRRIVLLAGSGAGAPDPANGRNPSWGSGSGGRLGRLGRCSWRMG